MAADVASKFSPTNKKAQPLSLCCGRSGAPLTLARAAPAPRSFARAQQLVGMPATVKLLGVDLDQPLLVEVDPNDTIAGLKDRALEKWPAGVCARVGAAPARPRRLSASRLPSPARPFGRRALTT